MYEFVISFLMVRKTSKRERYQTPTEDKNQEYMQPDLHQRVGAVTALLGGGRFICDVWNIDTENFSKVNCSIPGKFKGKNKKNNEIHKGSVVLINIGMRNKDNEIPLGDIELIYTKANISKLISDGYFREETKSSITMNEIVDEMDDSGIEFETETEISFEKL